MINLIHQKTKGFVFKRGTKDWHYLVLNSLLAAIIVFPIVGSITPFKSILFDALFVSFILYGMLLLNKPPLILLITGMTAMIVLFSASGPSLASLPVSKWLVGLSYITLFLYFFVLGIRLFRDMLNEEVSLKFIYTSIANYLIIGLVFSFLFQLTHLANAEAFNFPFDARYNHVYMSFIILTSVGLGDLLPLTSAAKSLVIMEAVAGQLYLTFFVAIVVGKYLSKSFKK
ncbi:MAG: ion channel [bacterium]|nr:ion channel [bacterium]